MLQKRLKELLLYNPDTGVFTRRLNTRNRFKAGQIAGSLTSKGYIDLSLDRKTYSAHRMAWLYIHGVEPVDQIDHINHNRSDNRLANIREVSASENSRNRSCYSRSSKKGGPLMGVRWDKDRGRWLAQIKIGGIAKHLGRHKDLFSAICARKSAELKHGFHSNHGKNITAQI